MSWKIPLLRERRQQVRDAVASHLPGADASVPNSVLRVLSDAVASLTHDNDRHLAWLARMQIPDTAEGEWIERWANIFLPLGRKGATAASGWVQATGVTSAAIATGTLLTASTIDAQTGLRREILYRVTQGAVISSSTVSLPIEAVTLGAAGNLDEGAQVSFQTPPDGVDGLAVISAPGLAGGADIEADADLRLRTIDRIQSPPHGGSAHDYVQWALEVPGVTRAWARQEMGVGTVTVRVMLDEVRRTTNGLPEPEDLMLVRSYIDPQRPVTVADLFVVAPVAQPLNISISALANDTPEIRSAIRIELSQMLLSRSAPGQMIYASWVREAISAASGEDHHDISISNIAPLSAGHIIIPGTVSFS